MSSSPRLDVNCDLGEAETPSGISQDLRLLPFVTSVNIACGGHAGTAESMRRLVAAAIERGLAIGAHPGFPDRATGGRQEQPWTAEWIKNELGSQINRLQTIARELGARLTHVKPHGALYNMAARDLRLADAIASTVQAFDRSLILVGLAGSELLVAGQNALLRVAAEGFADRAYYSNGHLIPRSQPDALVTDEALVVARALTLALEHSVIAGDGTSLRLHVDTLCLHGDTAGALRLAKAVYDALQNAGVIVRRIDRGN
ncbi:MAG: LamB/YcsF family protein [Nitrospiraceae bacterium]|nr:LamB/YcsF family protein [Nitrospiraceae bacterium]